MKHRLLSLLLLLALLTLPLLSAAGAETRQERAEDYPLVLTNRNRYALDNNPKYEAEFAVNREMLLQALTTLHWNYGKGKAPGKITLMEDGKAIGTWKAAGRTEEGVKDACWDIFPKVVLQPEHTYRIVDSDYKTWSTNDQAGGKGIYELRGEAAEEEETEDAAPETVLLCADWAKPELQEAEAAGLFSPTLLESDLRLPITREEFAGVCVRVISAAGQDLPPAEKLAGQNPFADTENPEVLQAYALGITLGSSSSTFSPFGALTREQGAVMLDRTWNVLAPGTVISEPGSPFADSEKVSTWAADSVRRMAAAGLVQGTGENRFSPGETLSRQEAMVIALRLLTRLA